MAAWARSGARQQQARSLRDAADQVEAARQASGASIGCNWLGDAERLTLRLQRPAGLPSAGPALDNDLTRLAAVLVAWADWADAGAEADSHAARLRSLSRGALGHVLLQCFPALAPAVQARAAESLAAGLSGLRAPSYSDLSLAQLLQRVIAAHADALGPDAAVPLLARLVAVLHDLSDARSLRADAWHAEVLDALVGALDSTLRCVPAAEVVAQSAALADLLSRMWTFGVPYGPSVSSDATSYVRGTEQRNAYVPPSRRPRVDSDSGDPDTAPRQASTPGSVAWSDCHDAGAATESQGAAVRRAALQALRSALQHAPAALHSVWDRFLPQTTSPEPGAGRREMTLVGVLTRDPDPAVRATAAAALADMFGGPKAKAFMAVAALTSWDGRLGAAQGRPFMSLSVSLGAMLCATHVGLAASMQREPCAVVQGEVVRAAALLIERSPYERLPAVLLPDMLACALPLWPAEQERSAQGLALASAIISIISAAVTSSAPLQPSDWGHGCERSDCCGSPALGVGRLLLAAAESPSTTLHLEAVIALRRMCKHRFRWIDSEWGRVLALAKQRVSALDEEARKAATSDDGAGVLASRPMGSRSSVAASTSAQRAAHQALSLAGEHLAAASARAPSVNAPSPSAACSASSSADAAASETGAAKSACPSQADGSRGEALLQLALGLAASDTALPAHRCAGLASLAPMLPVLWSSMQQPLAWQAVHVIARVATRGGSPAERSTATAALAPVVRAVGWLCTCPDLAAEAWAAIESASGDDAVSVRVAAANATVAACVAIHETACGGDDSADELVDRCVPSRCSFAPQPSTLTAFPPKALRSLQACVARALHGSDKVRSSGARAARLLLHALAAEDAPGERSTAHASDSDAARDGWQQWSATAAAAVADCLQSQSPKVAWNACVCAGSMLARQAAEACWLAPDVRERLWTGLLSCLQRSSNFKVRINAARALLVIGGREAARNGMLVRSLLAIAAASREVHRQQDPADQAVCGDAAGPAAAAAPGAPQAEHASTVAPCSSEAGTVTPLASFLYSATLSGVLVQSILDFVPRVKAGHIEALAPELAELVAGLEREHARLTGESTVNRFRQAPAATDAASPSPLAGALDLDDLAVHGLQPGSLSNATLEPLQLAARALRTALETPAGRGCADHDKVVAGLDRLHLAS